MEEKLLEFLEKVELHVPKICFLNVDDVQRSLCIYFNDHCDKGYDCAKCLLCEDHAKQFKELMKTVFK